MASKRVLREKVESEPKYFFISGPLGLWPFPILNSVLRFLYELRRIYYNQVPSRRRRISVYEVVRDEKGRIVEIVEHVREEVET